MGALGRLERVELRDVWISEALTFTPWLAAKENLEILSNTLGIDLVLEAQEQRVGPFRADILCKDIDTDRWVLIENQLERTDHTHLGQLLTYAAGLEAVTIVWVAARFTEEHRATLDWLNKITDDSFQFFGLEIELWRIGNSPAAPKFNIVSKPNNWSQSVSQAARTIDDVELSDTRLLQRAYWEALNVVLDSHGGPVSGNRKAQPQSWMAFPIGRSTASITAAMSVRKSRQFIRAELYLRGVHAKTNFTLLKSQREEIERELGYALEWDELPEGQDCRIFVAHPSADPTDEAAWPEQHEWLASRLNELHRAFSRRVADID